MFSPQTIGEQSRKTPVAVLKNRNYICLFERTDNNASILEEAMQNKDSS